MVIIMLGRIEKALDRLDDALLESGWEPKIAEQFVNKIEKDIFNEDENTVENQSKDDAGDIKSGKDRDEDIPVLLPSRD